MGLLGDVWGFEMNFPGRQMQFDEFITLGPILINRSRLSQGGQSQDCILLLQRLFDEILIHIKSHRTHVNL